MDWDFAAIGQLVLTLPASYPVLVHRLASLLRASFRPRLAASVISPLRFAITSRPSRCEEDLHLQAVDPARHTTKRAVRPGWIALLLLTGCALQPGVARLVTEELFEEEP